jgi:hypothetical protein
MRDIDFMQLALGPLPPWQVTARAFDADKRRLDIEIDFLRDYPREIAGCH